MADLAISSLMWTFESFFEPPYFYYNLFPNPETELSYREVWFLKQFLDEEIIPHFNHRRLIALEGQIKEEIPKFEYVLDSHVNKYHSLSKYSGSIGNVSNELIMSFSQDLEKVKQEMNSSVETIRKIKEQYIGQNDPPETCNGLLLLTYPVSQENDFGGGGGLKENMVGLVDQQKNLVDGLLEEISLLKIVAVVGMAGVGKTTLVKEVLYNHPSISSYFDLRVFVTVGPECHLYKVLLDILGDLYSKVDVMQIKREDELCDKIHDGLKGRRVLIVLDDVWNIEILNRILCIFPDNNNGSRILLTTRLLEVANRYEVHPIRFMNKEESWMLFCKKMFVDGSCPPKLEKVGKKIVQNCEGLPLGIISIANLLSEGEITLEYLEKEAVDESLLARATNDGTPISKSLFLSYKQLSSCLKECFLYLGVFPVKYEIFVSKLVKLWVAEGLIGPSIYTTFEENAESYLEDLISRNIVLIRQRSSNGRIKTCNAQSFFWHICLREAEKDNFFHIIKHDSTVSETVDNHQRLCIHNNVLLGIKDIYKSTASASNVYSLLCTGPHHQYPVPIYLGFTSLRVLDALSIRYYKFPVEIVELVELRYLAFTLNGKLPSSISRLQKLRYLILHQYMNIISSGPPSYMPIEIWKMQNLRHLQVMGSDLPDPVDCAQLPNLLTLLDVSARSCTKNVLEKIPNLERIGLQIGFTESTVSETLRIFDHLSLLHELKSFKCVVSNPNPRSQQVLLLADPISSIFPSSLEKLSLSGCGFDWKDDMSLIGALPNLQVLKLRCYAFQGPEWESDVKEFPKLEYLLLEDTDLVHWRVKDNCFPQLQRLIIRHCYKLEQIPSALGDIATLKMIELVDLSPSAVDSAKKIQKKQQELGNKNLQFQVNSSWMKGSSIHDWHLQLKR